MATDAFPDKIYALCSIMSNIHAIDEIFLHNMFQIPNREMTEYIVHRTKVYFECKFLIKLGRSFRDLNIFRRICVSG